MYSHLSVTFYVTSSLSLERYNVVAHSDFSKDEPLNKVVEQCVVDREKINKKGSFFLQAPYYLRARLYLHMYV